MPEGRVHPCHRTGVGSPGTAGTRRPQRGNGPQRSWLAIAKLKWDDRPSARESTMRKIKMMIVAALVALPAPALAQAVPKVGTCPSGYHTSGGACIPSSGNSRPALPKVGSCPSGYHSSGDYCLGSETARHAIPKTGSCPSGYHASGAYCLSFR